MTELRMWGQKARGEGRREADAATEEAGRWEEGTSKDSGCGGQTGRRGCRLSDDGSEAVWLTSGMSRQIRGGAELAERREDPARREGSGKGRAAGRSCW